MENFWNQKEIARKVRREFRDELSLLEKVPEDDLKRSEEAIQKTLDEYIEKLEAAAAVKEKELLGIE